MKIIYEEKRTFLIIGNKPFKLFRVGGADPYIAKDGTKKINCGQIREIDFYFQNYKDLEKIKEVFSQNGYNKPQIGCFRKDRSRPEKWIYPIWENKIDYYGIHDFPLSITIRKKTNSDLLRIIDGLGEIGLRTAFYAERNESRFQII